MIYFINYIGNTKFMIWKENKHYIFAKFVRKDCMPLHQKFYKRRWKVFLEGN